MSDKAEDLKETAEPESPKRGRPAGKASKPKRENYADQLKQLRTRVGFAVSILKKIKTDDKTDGPAVVLVDIAIETLEQE